MREEPRFIITYVDADSGEHLWQEEHACSPAVVGQGVELPNGGRYRVADVWSIYPKRGPLEYGVHAFVRRADGDEDLLGRLWPSYYYGKQD